MNTPAYITTSWDDGHPSDFRLAEMLAKYRLRGTFYIPREAQTGTMPPAQVRELASLVELGAHTMHHVFLDRASDAVARREIVESKAWIEEMSGRRCELFCPPGGKFDTVHLQMIREAGFVGIRTVELLSLDFPRPAGDLLLMPTTLQAFPHNGLRYLRNAYKRRAPGNLWRYITHGIGRDWPRLAESLLRNVVKNGGVFHLWGHSWELEVTAQWQRLEEVFSMMGNYAAQVPCLTNSQICALHPEIPADPVPV